MSTPYQFTVPATITVTEEQIDDLMTTALEGGICYWCASAKPLNNDYKGATYASHAVSKGATLCLVDSMTGATHHLDVHILIRGIVRACQANPDYLLMFLDPDNHGHNLDAGRADVIVQLAIFGETLYG